MVYDESVPFTFNAGESQDTYVTANRNFEMGDEILAEDALLVGPIAEPRYPICLGCGVIINTSTKCYDCGWPICDFDCDKLIYHKSYECEIFKKCSNMSFQRLSSNRGIFHQYDCILPMRALLLSERSPDKWRFIEKLNSCVDIRRDTTIWQKELTYVVKYIRQKCKLKRFSEELIHKVCGAIDANSFHTNTKYNLRCIFGNCHYFSHSCLPNTTCVISPSSDFRIFIRASVNIKKGENLTHSRVKPILPTLLRRQELVHTSCLSCRCPRCKDASELHSNFSSLKCTKCQGSILSMDPLEFEADWKCVSCSYKMKYNQLKKLYNNVERELNKIEAKVNIEESVGTCEKLLEKYETVFHFNHAFIVFLKYYSLMDFNEGTFHTSNLQAIDQKIIRLHEILRVFDIISPGFTALRGTTFNWLYKAYVAKAKWYDTNKSADREYYVKHMSQALKYLEMTESIMVIGKPFSMKNINAS